MAANHAASGCRHAVVGFDFVEFEDTLGYFMPKYTRGDLLNFIKQNDMSEAEIKRIAYQIVCAIDFLHGLQIVHRDVKPDNVFLSGDDDVPDAYLGDFGLTDALNAQPDRRFTEPVGSRPYCAPELLQGLPYDHTVDIWAFGVTLYVMFVRNSPFPDENTPDFMDAVLWGDWRRDLLLEKEPSNDAVQLIDACLAVASDERPSTSQILSHPFFQDVALADTKTHFDELESALHYAADDCAGEEPS
jgi:serine/threonine protein kinase